MQVLGFPKIVNIEKTKNKKGLRLLCYVCYEGDKNTYATIPAINRPYFYLCAGHDMQINGIFIDSHSRAPISDEDLRPVPKPSELPGSSNTSNKEKTPD